MRSTEDFHSVKHPRERNPFCNDTNKFAIPRITECRPDSNLPEATLFLTNEHQPDIDPYPQGW